jgi:hypothetical protein
LLRLISLVLALLFISSAPAEASKWTGPTLAVIEAKGFTQIPCPKKRVLHTEGTDWKLSASGVCLKARWTKLLEAHTVWPKAMTAAFMKGLGRYVYLSAPSIPAGAASLLLVPGPIYGKLRPIIVGSVVRARLVGDHERFAQIDSNVLQPAPGDDTSLRLDLRWSGWQVGSLAAGPKSTTSLVLMLKRSCLPSPVEIIPCATSAVIGRSGRDPIPSTSKVSGRVDFASPPTGAATIPFAGTMRLDVRSNSEVDDKEVHRLIHVRVADGELEETLLPVERSRRRLLGGAKD